MDAVIDIFARMPDGTPLWIEALRDWRQVQKRMNELRAIAPSDYFIYSERDGIVQEEDHLAVH